MNAPIYIDVTSLFDRNLTGIGRYVARMVDQVARKTPVRLLTSLSAAAVARIYPRTGLKRNREIRLTPEQMSATAVDLHKWRDDLLQRPTAEHDAAIAKRSAGVYPFMRPEVDRQFAREVAFLYDLSPIILPDTHKAETVEMFGKYCSSDVHEHDAILAISDSTKNDAEWFCGIPGERVAVAYPGPSQCVAEHSCRDAVARRDNFALVVSTLEPRKNGAFLLKWFMTTKTLPTGFELHWAGPRGWLEGAGAFPSGNPFRRRIRFLGMVPDKELCRLYKSARFTAYPSLYEGFGFPVLDSLRHGAPVLCAFNSSLCEFAGPGVHFFDPCDASSLDAACVELLQAESHVVTRPDLEERCNWSRAADLMISLCHAS